MPNIISHYELHQTVRELSERTLNRKQPERKVVWDQLLTDPFMDRLPAGFALFNEDFMLMKCNRVYADYIRQHTPFTAEQALGMCHFDYKPGSAKFSAPWFRHVRDSRNAETCYDFELRVLMEGDYVLSYWDVHLSPIIDRAGRTVGSIMCCLDVAERHTIKTALLEKDERFGTSQCCLEEIKTALRVLSVIKDEEKRHLENELLANVKLTLCPWIEGLKNTRLNPEQKAYVDIIESNLADISSSFVDNISSRVGELTPAEIKVAQLVKVGKTSKEIASLLAVSKECVDFHRNNLRKKLGLNKQKVALRSHLCSLAQ